MNEYDRILLQNPAEAATRLLDLTERVQWLEKYIDDLNRRLELLRRTS